MNKLIITINCMRIQNGIYLPLKQVQYVPKIEFVKEPNTLYTIVVVDPDAPSPKNPIYKYVLHWLIINNNEEINEFKFPSPPPGSGKHRYYFFLLKQKNKLDKNEFKNLITERTKFNLANFIHKYDLIIVDKIYFQSDHPLN